MEKIYRTFNKNMIINFKIVSQLYNLCGQLAGKIFHLPSIDETFVMYWIYMPIKLFHHLV